MAKGCTVCQSEHRHSVDVGLTHRISHRVLAARFGLSVDSVQRHAANHLSPVQRAAILAAQKPTPIDPEALAASESSSLLCQLVTQRARLQATAEMAASMGDVRASVSAEGAITSNLALVAKLLGMIIQKHDVRSTSLLVSPDYLALRSTLHAALRPYPEAARAVAAALYAMESEAAADITARARAKTPMLIEHEAGGTPTPGGKNDEPAAGAGAALKSTQNLKIEPPPC